MLIKIFSFYKIKALYKLKIEVMLKNWVDNLRNEEMNNYNHDNMRSEPVN